MFGVEEGGSGAEGWVPGGVLYVSMVDALQHACQEVGTFLRVSCGGWASLVCRGEDKARMVGWWGEGGSPLIRRWSCGPAAAAGSWSVQAACIDICLICLQMSSPVRKGRWPAGWHATLLLSMLLLHTAPLHF